MNRVALIVGVGPGLGAALARRFASGGFRVALVARRPEFSDQLARELSSLGQPSLAVAADASRPAEIAAAGARVGAELGPIGLLLYDASSSSGDGLMGTSAAQFEESWHIAALGAFVCAQQTARIASGSSSRLTSRARRRQGINAAAQRSCIRRRIAPRAGDVIRETLNR